MEWAAFARWVIEGAALVFVLSVFVALGVGAIVRKLSRELSDFLESEAWHPVFARVSALERNRPVRHLALVRSRRGMTLS